MISEQKVINWFAVKSDVNKKLFPAREELTQLRLMKLLYFTQGTYLALNGHPLIDDKVVNAPNGPMFESAHHLYNGSRALDNKIDWDQSIKDFTELSNIPEVNIVLNSVFNKYANVKTGELVNISHRQEPWQNTKSGQEITQEEMKNYFKKIVVRDNG